MDWPVRFLPNSETRLTLLHLHGNQLTGEIPAELGNLTNLTELSLNANPLTGGVLAELGNLTHLIHLYLQYTGLEGTLPLSLANLSDLGHFHFNLETTIRYDVPQSDHVTLVVFDLLGRQVRVLLDGVIAAGAHEVRFDAGLLPGVDNVYPSVTKTRRLRGVTKTFSPSRYGTSRWCSLGNSASRRSPVSHRFNSSRTTGPTAVT